MKKQKLKYDNSQYGITLIALVITIVVLLILAIVSIKLLINNGIIGKTQDARILTQLSQVDEAINLYKSDLAMELLKGEITDDNLIEKEILKEYVIEETLRPIAVIVDYNKLNINSKFGEGYTEINEYTVEGESVPYIATNNELNNVCAIDLTTHTLYYIKDGRVWSLEGNTDILNNYKRVNAGEGEWTFDPSTKTLTAYNGDLTTIRGEQTVGEIIIPNYYKGTKVKAIGFQLFNGKINLTKVTIAEGIETIEGHAFRNCKNLTGNLIIPDSIISIGSYSFENCNSLTGEINLSNNLITIGNYAFNGCSNLTGDLIIPNAVKYIGGMAFAGCTSLDGKIELGNNIKTIGSGAFKNCKLSTGYMVIPKEVTQIADRTFESFNSLHGSIELGTNVISLGSHAFYPSSFESIKFLNKECIIYDSQYTISSSIKIIGYAGSTAEEYATKYNRTFEVIE